MVYLDANKEYKRKHLKNGIRLHIVAGQITHFLKTYSIGNSLEEADLFRMAQFFFRLLYRLVHI